MSAQTAKITPGRWEVSQYGSVVGGEYHEYTNGFAKSQVALATMSDAVTKASMRDANAELIAEAGTVANETGLTPRQLADALKEEKFERQQVCAALTREVIKTEKLADQRAKLLTACEELLLYEDYPHDVGNRDDAFYKIVELARAAVKAAKQVNP